MKHKGSDSAVTETQPILEYVKHGFKIIHPNGTGNYVEKNVRMCGRLNEIRLSDREEEVDFLCRSTV